MLLCLVFLILARPVYADIFGWNPNKIQSTLSIKKPTSNVSMNFGTYEAKFTELNAQLTMALAKNLPEKEFIKLQQQTIDLIDKLNIVKKVDLKNAKTYAQWEAQLNHKLRQLASKNPLRK